MGGRTKVTDFSPDVWPEVIYTWMKTEAFLTGSQRNSMVLRCRGCERGSSIPTDSGISASNEPVCQSTFALMAWKDSVTSVWTDLSVKLVELIWKKITSYTSTHHLEFGRI